MNRYVLEDKIGEGTFGIVYRAKKKGVPGKVSRKLDLKHQIFNFKIQLLNPLRSVVYIL